MNSAARLGRAVGEERTFLAPTAPEQGQACQRDQAHAGWLGHDREGEEE